MNNILYRITATDIKKHNNQKIIIEKFDIDEDRFINIENDEYLKLFEFDIYSQKQIYEIAQSPNALRKRIDSAIPNVKKLEIDYMEKKSEFVRLSSQIYENYKKIESKKIYEAELEEVTGQIKSYNESGIAELLNTRRKFVDEHEKLNAISDELTEKQVYFDSLEEQLSNIELDSSEFCDKYTSEINTAFIALEENINKCIEDIQTLKKDFLDANKNFKGYIKNSQWKTDCIQNKDTIDSKKAELGEKGFKDINDFESLLVLKENKINKIKNLEKVEKEIEDDIDKKKEVYEEILLIRSNIYNERNEFLNEILKDKNVQMKVNYCRDKESFERDFRDIMQKPNEYESSINYLIEKCFRGKLPDNLVKIHQDLDELSKGHIPSGYDGYFKKFIMNLSNEQFEKLKLLIPEDEIVAQYKPTESDTFKSISNASAGQKTATILTFILAHGDTPLILDQPEDDLDNHLVYGLIVDRLRESKENRQIIVVTHNANIPVNGDTEYITAMNSSSKYLEVICKGAIEEGRIRNEICDVMEGGEVAFKLRSKRYNL